MRLRSPHNGCQSDHMILTLTPDPTKLDLIMHHAMVQFPEPMEEG